MNYTKYRNPVKVTYEAQYVVVETTDEYVLLHDLNGPKSITNDAERVVAEVFNEHGDKRIFYKDTIGNIDEMLHMQGCFITFSPGGPPKR